MKPQVQDDGEDERVRLDGGGYYDSDIYDNANGNKYANYVESIGLDDMDVSVLLFNCANCYGNYVIVNVCTYHIYVSMCIYVYIYIYILCVCVIPVLRCRFFLSICMRQFSPIDTDCKNVINIFAQYCMWA